MTYVIINDALVKFQNFSCLLSSLRGFLDAITGLNSLPAPKFDSKKEYSLIFYDIYHTFYGENFCDLFSRRVIKAKKVIYFITILCAGAPLVMSQLLSPDQADAQNRRENPGAFSQLSVKITVLSTIKKV